MRRPGSPSGRMRSFGHPWPDRPCCARGNAGKAIAVIAADSFRDVPARSRRSAAVRGVGSMSSGDHDLIGQEGMAVGQIEHRLVRQLLGMIGPRPPLEDDLVIGVDDVEVADPAAGDPVDMALDELGEFLVALADPEPPELCPGAHTSACQSPT